MIMNFVFTLTLKLHFFNPRPYAAFYSIQLLGGGSVGPPVVRPLMILELRDKNERVARNEKKPMVSNFMVLGQPVTSEIRSNTQILYLRRRSCGRYKTNHDSERIIVKVT